MAMITWADEMALGHAGIDAEHMRLVRVINEFEQTRTLAEAEKVARRLYRLTIDHFNHEEREQARFGYAGLQGHVREHQLILGDFKRIIIPAFIHRQADDPLEVIWRLALLTHGFVIDHMLESDSKLKPLFEEVAAADTRRPAGLALSAPPPFRPRPPGHSAY